ncbi:MBL fold metallo-hydrolase [Patiriisocius hiemis]|uniref:MBL fold metallo-hydrolase n=1 Tax=Patiriisocius hiemis TaxID=3075604 RepID=A0ABU2Y8C5_9FLAO|nr:MBL fold metallo-hydrolase [Constantimarinum sp. W242]MDT0554431.1 MBL fold metallo-hydrolase [Constantimarinum sp. W242]
MKKFLLVVAAIITIVSCKNKSDINTDFMKDEEIKKEENTTENTFKVTPISHATMVLEIDGKVIYVDPVGERTAFKEFKSPDLILVTDIHGDHLNAETIEAVRTSKTKIIVPQAVADKLPESLKTQIDVLNNGETKEHFELSIEAIPMYNLREEALKFHSKGRGNGYVIESNNERIYISGDTEDIPEMRALKNIDRAFVCMNLPYTMPVANAADAVLEFKPKKVYPYHYRGTEGLSDVDNFKSLIKKGATGEIEVVQLDWYPSID